MASKTQTRMQPLPSGEVWPPDDTEESILGTDLHQTAITNLRWGLNEVAELRRLPRQPVPWKAISQIMLLGCLRADGLHYRIYPDIAVFSRHIDPDRGSVTLDVDGAPLLVVEVLSEATYVADLDPVRGNGFSYARAGVREYLAIDPSRGFVPQGIRAWRLAGDRYHPWEPEGDGHWQSAQMELAIGMEGAPATVYASDGRRMLRQGEVERERALRLEEIARRDEIIAQQADEIARLRRRLEELRGE